MKLLLAIASTLVLWGCQSTDRDYDQPKPAAEEGGAGSCLMVDPTASGLKTCQELSGSTSPSTNCKAFGHQWQNKKCDPSAYERRCVSKGKESVNDGPEREVTQTDFFATGSKMTCLGQESDASDTSSSADQETAKGEALKVGVQTMAASEVEARLAQLPPPDLEVDGTILWGGVVSPGKAFVSDEFAINYTTKETLSFEVVSFAAPKDCLEAVGMALKYEFASANGGGEISSHWISGGVMKPMADSFPVANEAGDGKAGTVKVTGKVKPKKPLSERCPFLASFRLKS